MKPDWKSYAQGFAKNMHIGTVTYADYGYYSHTAFGPSWMDSANQPGQGNNNFNTFDHYPRLHQFYVQSDQGPDVALHA